MDFRANSPISALGISLQVLSQDEGLHLLRSRLANPVTTTLPNVLSETMLFLKTSPPTISITASTPPVAATRFLKQSGSRYLQAHSAPRDFINSIFSALPAIP